MRNDLSKAKRRARPEVTLGRILEALELELIDASDAEILEAAKDLGMDPAMKGSAAFLGLKGFSRPPRFEDFFSVDAAQWVQAQAAARRLSAAPVAPQRARPPRKTASAPRPKVSRSRKQPRD
jgi:hypothetical protein